MLFKTVIIEDEFHSLERLKSLLKDFEQIQVIGEARDGKTAIKIIEQLKPDLLFLDIELPVFNGFQVLEKLTFHPLVIFVTSYNQYAIKAFEENAVDYLLKPTSQKRLEKSINRISESTEKNNEKLVKLLKSKIFPEFLDIFSVKIGDEILIIPTEDIYFFRADTGYTFLHTFDKEYIYDTTLKDLENSLDPKKFIRVSKSNIVVLEKILKISKWFKSEYSLKMQDRAKTTIKIGRKYLSQLRVQFKF
jgi:DNA-binding LytR/AlgR family response regulator